MQPLALTTHEDFFNLSLGETLDNQKRISEPGVTKTWSPWENQDNQLGIFGRSSCYLACVGVLGEVVADGVRSARDVDAVAAVRGTVGVGNASKAAFRPG